MKSVDKNDKQTQFLNPRKSCEIRGFIFLMAKKGKKWRRLGQVWRIFGQLWRRLGAVWHRLGALWQHFYTKKPHFQHQKPRKHQIFKPEELPISIKSVFASRYFCKYEAMKIAAGFGLLV